MSNNYFRFLIYFVCIFFSGVCSSIDISAEFTPSVSNPGNQKFVNTTPLSGYCKSWPQYCLTDQFSIAIPGRLTQSYTMKANDTQRNSAYFKFPSTERDITVQSAEGKTYTLKFRVTAISAMLHAASGTLKDWSGGGFVYAPSPCSYSGVGVGVSTWYSFMWKLPKSGDERPCVKISTIERTSNYFDDLSIGYELTAPDPLLMNGGVYTGSLTFSVGPGGDIDVGDNFQAQIGSIPFNFKLTVNHELKITTDNKSKNIQLEPPGGWAGGLTPVQYLRGRSHFNITSSGDFHVYLLCSHQSGDECAVSSEKTGELIPVSAYLTLPENIHDKNLLKMVKRQPIYNGKDLTKNIFHTVSYSQNRLGFIDFEVARQNVEKMFSTRPDIYSGNVTVFFEPNLY